MSLPHFGLCLLSSNAGDPQGDKATFPTRIHRIVAYYMSRITYWLGVGFRRVAIFWPVAVLNRSRVGTNPALIGITVSTNYTEALSRVITQNLKQLDEWIVVTQQEDEETIALLKESVNSGGRIHIVFWNPNTRGRKFDFGGGRRAGQRFAHSRFPGAHYLLLDSDIALSDDFETKKQEFTILPRNGVYGAKRRDYYSVEGFESKAFDTEYPGSAELHGYFQLYFVPVLSRHSFDASQTDLEFRDMFPIRKLVPGLYVDHLGRPGNWDGSGPSLDA